MKKYKSFSFPNNNNNNDSILLNAKELYQLLHSKNKNDNERIIPLDATWEPMSISSPPLQGKFLNNPLNEFKKGKSCQRKVNGYIPVGILELN